MNTWAGFIRVSDMGGRTAGADDFHSDRDQTAAIKAAVPKGDKLVMLAPELDVSGGLPLEKRPSLLQAVQGVEDGAYCGIIVAYLSRLGRNTREQLRAWDRVEQAGGRIICAAENIDTATASGRFMRTVLLANAEREREEHVDRFENLRRWATEAGIWQGRVTPRGYVKGDDRKLEPGPDADLVRAVFRDRAMGASTSELATRLNMSTSGVRGMLRNEVYRGVLRVGDHVNHEAHPALIDHDTWLQVQAATPTRPAKQGRTPALLSGLARCQGCGHVLSRTGSPENAVYACGRIHASGKCAAPAGALARRLDPLVEGIALACLARLTEADVSHNESAVKATRALLDAAREELDHFLVAMTAASMPKDAYAAAARARMDAVEAAQTRHAHELAANSARAVSGDAIALWDRMSTEQRNHALRGLIEVVIVKRAGGRGGGRGPAVPLTDRVRVVAYGAGLLPAAPGSPLPFPDVEAEYVLRV